MSSGEDSLVEKRFISVLELLQHVPASDVVWVHTRLDDLVVRVSGSPFGREQEERMTFTYYPNSLRRGPTGPSSLAPATQDEMHPFIVI